MKKKLREDQRFFALYLAMEAGWEAFQEVEEFDDPRSINRWGPDLYGRRIYCSKFGFHACKPYMHPHYDMYIDSLRSVKGLKASTLCVIDLPPLSFRQPDAAFILSIVGINRVEFLRTPVNRWESMSLKEFFKGV